MQPSVYPLSLIFNVNTRFFNNAINGISPEQWNEKTDEHLNPACWVAAHIVFARYLALVFLGKPVNNPYQELFADFRGYDSALSYPSVEQVKQEWDSLTALLEEAMNAVSVEELQMDSPIKSPTGDFTNLGTLAFMAQHESYHTGQLAMLKRHVTAMPMTYN